MRVKSRKERRVEEIVRNSYRASHMKECEVCHRLYVDHSIDKDVLKVYSDYCLHVLCSGERVKL